ncbi:hypothetical protein JW948_18810 [bacterium]|nr:hypothetical protein [bacterium]
MKKVIWIFAAAALLLHTARPAEAHPPSNMTFSWDPKTGILQIDMHHPTPDVLKHIISEVVIEQNGLEIVRQEFKFQVTAESHKVLTLLTGSTKPGDTIRVTAKCNVFGKRTESFVIPGSSSQ